MGYKIYIGEAIIEKFEEEGTLDINVKYKKLDNAPAFGEASDYTNTRYPGYSQWSDFCKIVGLYELFFDEENGLFRDHPGIKLLKAEHLEIIRKKRIERQTNNPDLEPGFNENFKGEIVSTNKDGALARIVWLEYWVEWALKNCKIPAIFNS